MCLQLPSLPNELQREIVLWRKDDPDIHTRYALVSKNFYNWLRPYLYSRVRLVNTDMAAEFVDFMLVQGRPTNVQELYIGQLVDAVQAADVISECRNIKTLTIRPSPRAWYTALTTHDLLLQPLENLHNLRSLSISLVMLTDKTGLEVDLSEFQIFHQLTHLHLISSAGIHEIISEDLSALPNLTHLSLHWFQSEYCITGFRQFLARPSTRTLVLWVPDIALPDRLERKLVDYNLVDRRIVMFVHERFNEYTRRGSDGFWKYAERLVTWRVEKNKDSFATNVWIEVPAWDKLLRGKAKKLPAIAG